MSKLIIAEKPSVAKSIASALGASSRADGFVCNKGNHLLCRWKRKSFSEERSDKIKTP